MGEFTKITKTEARKRYEAGESVYLVPCKMRIDSPWGHSSRAVRDVTDTRTFQQVVNGFEYYNCFPETGNYAAYYIKEEVRK